MLFIFMLCLCLLTHSLFISFFYCIMHSAINLFVFPNSMFIPFFFGGVCFLNIFYERAMTRLGLLLGLRPRWRIGYRSGFVIRRLIRLRVRNQRRTIRTMKMKMRDF